MKRLHYSTKIKHQMTGRRRARRLRINWQEVKMFFAISIMPFGFLAALFVRILL